MKKSKLSKRTIWIIIIALAVIALVAWFMISRNNALKNASAAYQTQVVEKGDLTAIVGATGTVRANQSVNITWQTNGRIEEIKAEVGDKVSVNQVLATLAQSSLSQNIILAQADLVRRRSCGRPTRRRRGSRPPRRGRRRN